MRFKSLSVDKRSIEFCYNGVSVKVMLFDGELVVAEEITYEVATGSVLGNMRILLKSGKVYLISPFGQNEVKDPENILQGLRELSELVKGKSTQLYQELSKVLQSYGSRDSN
ncbi:MAG: hypothetical protein RXS23_05570 [Metallosphaera yellowstonensis]|jgi:hypothetical protein|uniref:Uncharacterized protein n=1 Tax=Metallosphaera yellowstonensis MK1 TaxID=671065 RepID=H2C5F6_9CREN|nr:hypothetical protein [Metallosphaera yellowstonensis]EHP69033.1 hypothetical protein MetMK1DRAFT_00017790 [Metallosphaera yellowstonensis MK1]